MSTPSSPETPWFCDDPDGEGLTWHATEEDAIAQAICCIAEWRMEAGEWPDEIESIVVGKVTQRATQVNLRACPPECSHLPSDWHCDIAMRPLAEYGQERAAYLRQQRMMPL